MKNGTLTILKLNIALCLVFMNAEVTKLLRSNKDFLEKFYRDWKNGKHVKVIIRRTATAMGSQTSQLLFVRACFNVGAGSVFTASSDVLLNMLTKKEKFIHKDHKMHFSPACYLSISFFHCDLINYFSVVQPGTVDLIAFDLLFLRVPTIHHTNN